MKFRSIGQRKRQIFSEPPSQVKIEGGVRNAGILGDQAKQILGALAQAQAENNQFRSANLDVLNRNELANSQLKFNAMATADGVRAANARLTGAIALRNQQLATQWQEETRRLQAIQDAERDQFEIQNQQYTNNQITAFGENLVNFSQSLWKTKAEEVNRRNEQAKAAAMVDVLLGRAPDVDASALNNLDNASTARLIKAAEGEALARALEAQGLQADANEIRTRNPFYLRQVVELDALRVAGEIPSLLEETRIAAQDKYRGATDADVRVEREMNNQFKQLLINTGLVNAPPDVIARYLGEAYFTNMAKQVRAARRDNAEYIKEARLRSSLVQAQTGIEEWKGDPEALSRYLTDISINSGGDFAQMERAVNNLGRTAIEYLEQTGDPSALNTLRDSALAQQLSPSLADTLTGQLRGFNERQEQKREKFLKETAATKQAEAAIAISQLNPGDFAREGQIKQAYLNWAWSTGDPQIIAKSIEWADSTNATTGDGKIVQRRLDEILRTTPREDWYTALMREAEGASDPLTAEVFRKQAEKYSFLEDPQWKGAIQTLRSRIDILAAQGLDPKKLEFTILGASGLPVGLEAAIKFRKQKLDQRLGEVLNGGHIRDVNKLIEWANESNPDIFERPFIDPATGRLTDEVEMTQQSPSLGASDAPEIPMVLAPNRKTMVVPLLGATNRRRVLEGKYGTINSNTTQLLDAREIRIAEEHFQRTGEHQQVIRQLARKANVPVSVFLDNQADLYDIPGRMDVTPPIKPSPVYEQPASFQELHSFAESRNLSNRGAIWFATNAIGETGGDPTKVGDNGTAFGMFQMRLDRAERLKKKPGWDKDWRVSAQDAIDEIRTEYPAIWKVITSPNPSFGALLDAQEKWLRYDTSNPTIKKRRAEALRYQLNN